MDLAILGLYVLSGASLLAFVLLLLGLRSLSAQILPVLAQVQAIRSNLGAFVSSMIWSEDEQTDAKGVSHTVKRLNPQVQEALEAIVPAITPFVVAHGLDWLKKNGSKLERGTGGPGMGGLLSGILGGGSGKGSGDLMEQLLPTLLERFLPGLLGGGGSGGAGGGGNTSNVLGKINP